MQHLKREKFRRKMKDLGRVQRRKIVIRKLTEGQDEFLNPIKTWEPWRTLWAECSNLWGERYYAAKAYGEEGTVEFILRYVPFLDQLNTTEFDVKFEGKEYVIKHIDHLEDDGMWIKISCLERGTHG